MALKTPLVVGTDGLPQQLQTADQFGTVNAQRVVLTGNISSPAWTTTGLRIAGVPATFTDTTSAGTVAAAYTDRLGGNTIAASSATTFTTYVTAYFAAPVAGTNVTFTNSWALGADSLTVGTSTPLQVTSAGVLTGGSTGAGFTVALSAATVTGTLADARLSSNVPLLNAANTFGNNMTVGGASGNYSLTCTNTTTGAAVSLVAGGIAGVAGSGILSLFSGPGLTNGFLYSNSSLNSRVHVTNGAYDSSLAAMLTVTSPVSTYTVMALRGAVSQVAPLLSLLQLASDNNGYQAGQLNATWSVNTVATRTGSVSLAANYIGTAQVGVAVLADSGGTAKVGFCGVTPVARATLPAAATDAATTMALANALRTALINLGLCQ